MAAWVGTARRLECKEKVYVGGQMGPGRARASSWGQTILRSLDRAEWGLKNPVVSCVRIHWWWAMCKQGGMLRAVVIIQVGIAGFGAPPEGNQGGCMAGVGGDREPEWEERQGGGKRRMTQRFLTRAWKKMLPISYNGEDLGRNKFRGLRGRVRAVMALGSRGTPFNHGNMREGLEAQPGLGSRIPQCCPHRFPTRGADSMSRPGLLLGMGRSTWATCPPRGFS